MSDIIYILLFTGVMNFILAAAGGIAELVELPQAWLDFADNAMFPGDREE